jgi:protein-disulfide isomerase
MAPALLAFGEDEVKKAGITSEQAGAILNELRVIRQLLERQPGSAAPGVQRTRTLRVDGKYVLGNSNAPLTIVEFTDYQCPYCREFEENTFGELRKQYIDTGKLRFVSRNLPLPGHPDAMRAAEAALCAGEQGWFWPMREALFRHQDLLSQAAVVDYARRFNIDTAAFQSCLESSGHQADILHDMDDAKALEINGTPSFLVGKTTDSGVVGFVVTGSLPFAQFESYLEQLQTGR